MMMMMMMMMMMIKNNLTFLVSYCYSNCYSDCYSDCYYILLIMSQAPLVKKRKHVVLTLAQTIHITEQLDAGDVGGKLSQEC